MDWKAFQAVFKAGFTQYFPHEHLDRWPKDFSPGGYAYEQAQRMRSRRPDWSYVPRNPHLYAYLLDGIEVAAGHLTELDQGWARRTFRSPSEGGTSDSDPSWNVDLARLGHALHTIEDFFAHSTFIELAARREGISDPSFFSVARTVIARRRLRYMGHDAIQGQEEDWVVTGYFDTFDTLFSLQHVLDGLLAPDGKDPKKEECRLPGLAELLRAVIGDLKLRLLPGAKPNARTRRLAEESILRQMARGDSTVSDAGRMVLTQIPGEMREVIYRMLVLLSATVPGQALSIYDWLVRLQSLFALIVDPLRAWIQWLADVLDMSREAIERIVQPIESILKRALERAVEIAFGRYRIGCHSLIAKDYRVGDPDLDRVHDMALACAVAVGQYVTATLARKNSPERDRVVNWLALLECVLRNPRETSEDEMWWRSILADGGESTLGGSQGVSKELASRFPSRYLSQDGAALGARPPNSELASTLERWDRLRRERESAYR